MLFRSIPYNNFVTGKFAFHHKAGMHTKAIYLNPSSYEIIDPADFGLERTLNVAHRLTGRNAIEHRAGELGLTFGKEDLIEITQRIKAMADAGPLSTEQLDAVLPRFVTEGMGVTFLFGGTSLLIVVGVAMDTVQQVESQLIMRHYDGFMKKTRIRGRRA